MSAALMRPGLLRPLCAAEARPRGSRLLVYRPCDAQRLAFQRQTRSYAHEAHGESEKLPSAPNLTEASSPLENALAMQQKNREMLKTLKEMRRKSLKEQGKSVATEEDGEINWIEQPEELHDTLDNVYKDFKRFQAKVI